MKSKRVITENPLEAPELSTLQLLRRSFSSEGFPPPSMRTPEDEARIAAFFALYQLMYLLEEFRRACAGGKRVRLVVNERGQSRSRIVVEIAILDAGGEGA
jgi:hypothetical protein